MISQEHLYQNILKEDWKAILKLLYRHKKEISTDLMLKQAATVFEEEFFKKLNQYALDRKDINENLETLFILNQGHFYKLSDENFKALVIEIVKRKPLKEAVNYASLFPEEENCKSVINLYEGEKVKENIRLKLGGNLSMNWIEIYNRLFELINNKDNNATYLTGAKFINIVKEFEPYFPDYNQYINQRNQEGKSTTRKIFYYGILINFQEEKRSKIINRILEILKPFEKEKVEKIEELLGKKITKHKEENGSGENILKANPIVFISYSWDDELHKAWVLNLANRLCSDGIDVLLDRYYLNPGKNLPYFVESSISQAQRIIIVFTPNYKLKADGRAGGVEYEYSILNAELYENQTSEKIIPVLRAGNKADSIPTFMQQFIHIDIRNNENFENSYTDLLREIYNEPAIYKPQLGSKPKFEMNNLEEIKKPIIGDRIRIK